MDFDLAATLLGYVIAVVILILVKSGKIDYFSLSFGKKNKAKKVKSFGNPSPYVTAEGLGIHCTEQHKPIISEMKEFREDVTPYLIGIADHLGVEVTRENPIEE